MALLRGDPVLACDISELERCPKYALRLFRNDFTVPYETGLEKAQWISLYDSRQCLKLR